MRPINLIPVEERRSHGGVVRTGPLPYIVVGALAVVLIGVVVLVLTSNTISTREGEVESLEAQKSAVAAKTAELAPYVSFGEVAQQRISTITELADGRFDWVRIIRQLSLVLPEGVFITNVTASAGGGSEAGGGISVGVPSLVISGCAPGQNRVAAFVAALKQIDGVTRVGLSNSSLSQSSGSNGEGSGVCAGASFNVTVVFDEAPPSVAVAGVAVEPPAEAGAPEGESSEGGEESESAPEGESTEAAGTAEGAPAAATEPAE